MLRLWVIAIYLMIGIASAASADTADFQRFVKTHCTDCHNKDDSKASLNLDALLTKEIDQNSEGWEKVLRKLASRQMPPKDASRPTEHEYQEAIASLEAALDAAAAKSPTPGRPETFRRLNRTEYQNVLRDVLNLEIDVASLLPADESSRGFDNITVADLSPSLLNRYISAAQKISRLAIGAAADSPSVHVVRVRPDVTQDTHIEGLPLGTRGGALVPYQFPVDGEYEIQVHLMRDRNEEIEGLNEPHELEMLVDKERIALLNIKPSDKRSSSLLTDAHLKSHIKVKAGRHQVGVTFLKNSSSLLETYRQPLHVHFNYYRHPRIGPAVYEVSIIGPFAASGPGDTPTRRKIFLTKPTGPENELDCAKQILSNLARRFYRRPVDDEDLKTPLAFYRQARAEGNFETAIESALSALLVQPQFLFRIERDPQDLPSRTAYHLSDFELASRLSFFLWSSVPDQELLATAERGDLSKPDMLESQVRRMLADPRSQSLVTNFASQWLYLRNLDSINPDMRLFPDFDDNLRQAMRRETELFFGSILREDRSVLDLIKADYTFLNERLAKHYGIPHIYGSRFRRVSVNNSQHRGGLLRHSSILTVTSYATRTSPVIRGHWVLQNLLGCEPPPPPPDVPTLTDSTVSTQLPMRERLKQHRANPACTTCHDQMDPVGFSLENFDAIGRWRDIEASLPIDASGALTFGSEFVGIDGLEQALLNHPDLFARTLTEKLLTFGIGRGVEHFDAPAVRQIVRSAKADNYRFSRFIIGIVQSPPFQMRMTP